MNYQPIAVWGAVVAIVYMLILMVYWNSDWMYRNSIKQCKHGVSDALLSVLYDIYLSRNTMSTILSPGMHAINCILRNTIIQADYI